MYEAKAAEHNAVQAKQFVGGEGIWPDLTDMVVGRKVRKFDRQVYGSDIQFV